MQCALKSYTSPNYHNSKCILQTNIPSGSVSIRLHPNSKTFKLWSEQIEEGKCLNLLNDKSWNVVRHLWGELPALASFEVHKYSQEEKTNSC